MLICHCEIVYRRKSGLSMIFAIILLFITIEIIIINKLRIIANSVRLKIAMK